MHRVLNTNQMDDHRFILLRRIKNPRVNGRAGVFIRQVRVIRVQKKPFIDVF